MTSIVVLKNLMKDFLSEYTFSNKEYFTQISVPKFTSSLILRETLEKKYGICMDLNFTFSKILTMHGFNNYLVKAYEQKPDGNFYDVYHLSIIVMINNRKYLADVGFGDHFFEPIPIRHKTIVGKIKVDVLDANKVYDIYTQNKLIVRVHDQAITDIGDINDNYQKFYKSTANDFPLCRKLYERIFDPINNQFVPITKKIIRDEI
ncbi:putative acetyltransferase [Cotonvirus japonicus]|uniref:Acetyltransferase n=1 Tax=Cotonvirus japonicus TaxID=2811091 RepID=A0ABM7NRF8_9VIRU|nr:putative acetyltransferase [Cotonvirus japonicus]BCS82677.1 putative acetyltransferase [Cotonvirus japonicus]